MLIIEQIPRINEPKTLWEKFLVFLERNRRDPYKISVGNILQPTTMKQLVLEEEQSISRESEASAGETLLSKTNKTSPPPDNALG